MKLFLYYLYNALPSFVPMYSDDIHLCVHRISTAKVTFMLTQFYFKIRFACLNISYLWNSWFLKHNITAIYRHNARIFSRFWETQIFVLFFMPSFDFFHTHSLKYLKQQTRFQTDCFYQKFHIISHSFLLVYLAYKNIHQSDVYHDCTNQKSCWKEMRLFSDPKR